MAPGRPPTPPALHRDGVCNPASTARQPDGPCTSMPSMVTVPRELPDPVGGGVGCQRDVLYCTRAAWERSRFRRRSSGRQDGEIDGCRRGAGRREYVEAEPGGRRQSVGGQVDAHGVAVEYQRRRGRRIEGGCQIVGGPATAPRGDPTPGLGIDGERYGAIAAVLLDRRSRITAWVDLGRPQRPTLYRPGW